jgi:cysteine-rich repeat protein
MSEPARGRLVAALALLAASCGRSSLYTLDPDGGAYEVHGGKGGNAASGSGGTAAQGGGSGGGAALGGGSGGALPSGGRGTVAGGSGGRGTPTGGRGPSAGRGSSQGGSSGRSSGMAGVPPQEHCRDGVLDAGEECDVGEGPYAHPAIELHSNGIVIELEPVVGRQFATDYYGYRNGSSHTGNENQAGSKIYFYRPFDEAGVYLVTHHGIDFETTGFVQPTGSVEFDVTELPDTFTILVSDDAGNVKKSGPTALLGRWDLAQESDGFLLGGIPFPGNWHIVVEPRFKQGIDSFTALSGDGYRTGLALAKTVELIASDEPGDCRRDCSVPRCGDGRLDAGEVCDDGNELPSDGCFECFPDDISDPLR